MKITRNANFNQMSNAVLQTYIEVYTAGQASRTTITGRPLTTTTTTTRATTTTQRQATTTTPFDLPTFFWTTRTTTTTTTTPRFLSLFFVVDVQSSEK